MGSLLGELRIRMGVYRSCAVTIFVLLIFGWRTIPEVRRGVVQTIAVAMSHNLALRTRANECLRD